MKLNPIASNMTEVLRNDGTKVLFSYKTPVACITDNEFFFTSHKWSNTTARHINKWRDSYGYPSQMTTVKNQVFFDNLFEEV